MREAILQTEYTYDKHNRLEWEHNYGLGKAVKYYYDGNGNITKKQEYGIVNGEIEKTPYKTDNYDYTTVTANSGQNSAWHDQLKSYNGNVIEYDAYGNPIVYKGKVLTWQGKKLASYDGKSMEYDYYGNRIKKGNTKYYRYGDKLIFENDGNTKIYYYYDESGVSGINVDGEEYYFKKNVLGDVEEIYDKHGLMLCRYIYDAWGKHRIYDTIGNEVLPEDLNIGNTNPIRYRGYYYDKEFKLYYLQSRYYDPDTCRFISPDGVEYVDPASVNGFNLYAYCNDNPVMYTDPSGTFVSTILGFLFGGLWGGLGALMNGEDFWEGALTGAISGALSGLAVDLGIWAVTVTAAFGGVSLLIGASFAVGLGFLFGTTGEIIGQAIRGEQMNLSNALIAGGITAATNLFAFGVSYIAGMGNNKNTRNLLKMLLPEYTPLWSWLFQGIMGWALPSFATMPGLIMPKQESLYNGTNTSMGTYL